MVWCATYGGRDVRRLVTSLAMALSVMLASAAAPAMAQVQDPDIAQVTGPDAAERLALSRRFIAAMQTEQMGEMIGQMTTTLSPQMTKDMGIEDRAAFNRAIMAATSGMMESMFDAMAPIYADIFTMAELQGLVDFYESDIGQSLMTKSYEAAPRMAAAMAEMMPVLMRDMASTMCVELECTAEQLREIKAAMSGEAAGLD